ncbi:MAG TPA: hypothetical protein VF905_00780 [Nitrospirota bacterium]|jgi:hypothetical protein
MKRIVVVAIVLGLAVAALSIPSVLANENDKGGPKVFDRNAVVFERTLGEWSAEWWQWAFSIPVAIHPLFDNGDCSVGQTAPVWFLGGSFVSNTAVRSCNVPAGTALFFPILNGEDSAVEESFNNGCEDPTFGSTIVGLRKCATGGQDGSSLSAEIDGAPVPHIAERFRIQSPAFGFTLPDDNLLKATTGNPYLAGAYFASVGDGYYLMLSPLPAGKHVIHFHGVAVNGFTLDIIYNLMVGK